MVLTRETHVGRSDTASLQGLTSPIPLIALATYSTCFSRLYSYYTCLIPLSPHSQSLLLLDLSASHSALALTVCFSSCKGRASRLTCHALKWISCGIFLLRSVFGKKKRQVKHGRCPDKSIRKSQTGFGKGADDRERSFT